MPNAGWNRIRYSLYAPFYDFMLRHAFKAQRARSIGLLNLSPGQRVLLVGAGTGLDLPHFPQGLSITATDITPSMIERLKLRAKDLPLDVRAEVMDDQALSLPDMSHDAAVLHLILAVIPDPRACLMEVHRVLRPGAHVAVFDKFLKKHEQAGLLRRVANSVSSIAATDINRRLEDIVEGTGFTIVHDEDASLSGFFRIALLKKT